MAAAAITLPYGPRHVFVPYHLRKERWGALVAHRRCGKTVACVNDLIAKALQCPLPHGRYAYVAPFLAQAKEVAWEYLKRFALPATADKNESELWVELVNGARIRIHGADNPDRLRGAYLDGVVLDEYADMRPSVWGEVIRPMLADRKGWATFIGTPKGRNEFFEIFERADASEDWFSVKLKASDTRILDKSELDEARRDMTPEQYEQEFECSFDAAILGAYYGKEIAKADADGRIVDFDWDPDLPVHTAWDLGKGANMAIWMFQIVADEIGVIDHYEGAHDHTIPDCVKVLQTKPYKWGDDWVPHDAKVKELGTGRTRIETMIDLKRNPRLVPDHTVMDGINSGRLLMSRVWFHKTRCKDGVEALRQYRAEYDEKVRTFKNEPRHDWSSHSADAYRYLAMAYKQIAPEKPKPRDRALTVGPRPVPGFDLPTFDDLAKLRSEEPRARERI
jgi:phage terminase large subunit